MYGSTTARRLRARIGRFSGDVSAGLGVVAQRFVAEMIYGIQASGSVLLTEVARTLQESIAVRKTHMRLWRNLQRPDLEGVVQDNVLRLAAPVIVMDNPYTVPQVNPSDPLAPPHVLVSIEKEGEGYTAPFLGARYIPIYRLSDWPFGSQQTECEQCEYATLRVQAWPYGDWFFNRWQGPVDPPWATDYVLDMSVDREIIAEFIQVPEIEDLDFVSDFEYFMMAIGETEDPLIFDRNAIEIGDLFELVFVLNGIPDIVELFFLQAVLQLPGLDLSTQYGVPSAFVLESWLHNLAQAELDFSELDARVQRVFAAYMTIGDADTAEFVRDTVSRVWPEIEFDESLYDNTWSPRLSATGDANNDGVLNIEHWNAIKTGNTLSDMQTYAEAAIQLEADDLPPEAPEEPAACSPECFTPASVQATLAVPGLAGNMNYADVSPLGPDVPLGTRISASAFPNAPAKFWCWWAVYNPNVLVHLSRERRNTFLLTNDADVVPIFDQNIVEIADHWAFTITVSPARGAQVVIFDGKRYVVGPYVSYATVRAEPLYSHLKVKRWKHVSGPGHGNPRYTWGKSATVRIQAGGYIIPEETSEELPPLVSISAADSAGGFINIAETYGWPPGYCGTIALPAPGQPGGPLRARAIPNNGYKFVRWESDYVPAPLRETAEIDPDRPASPLTLRASFQKITEYELTVNIATRGASPQCGNYITVEPAQKYYLPGTVVTLEAHPASGNNDCRCMDFMYWRGNGKTIQSWPYNSANVTLNKNRKIKIVMNENRRITAVFEDWSQPGTHGIQIHYHKPGWWNCAGYGSDRFHAELLNSNFPNINWNGVQVGEKLCFISASVVSPGGQEASLALTDDEKNRLEGSAHGNFSVFNGQVEVASGDQFVMKSGTWIVGTGNTSDEHSIVARDFATIRQSYENHMTVYINYKQRYYITDWGNNDRSKYFSNFLGETDIQMKIFKPPSFFCYYNDPYNPTPQYHLLVKKGGQHHCAYSNFPLGRVNNRLLCVDECNPPCY